MRYLTVLLIFLFLGKPLFSQTEGVIVACRKPFQIFTILHVWRYEGEESAQTAIDDLSLGSTTERRCARISIADIARSKEIMTPFFFVGNSPRQLLVYEAEFASGFQVQVLSEVPLPERTIRLSFGEKVDEK